MNFKTFKTDLAQRCRNIRPTRWWRFGIVALLYTLWCVWMHNAWLLLGLILLFDIYIAGYIPFTWWKKSKNKVLRTLMGWVDAIVYALILVYFIFNFIGQNYQIPSSSLEKTLLIGDYLFVNKTVYGPRVPMTPVHFPLVHNKLPILETDSYLDSPSNSYHRLAGFRDVEIGDIVVFNFPAGDTVATKFEESPRYYDILVKEDGWEEVNTNKAKYGDIVYRPVDRRTNFVKRVVGMPGQRFKIVNDVIYIDGVPYTQPENAQFNYIVFTSRPLTDDYTRSLGISRVDVNMLDGAGSGYAYLIPLTRQALQTMIDDGTVTEAFRQPLRPEDTRGYLFPEGLSDNWSLSNYGGTVGIWIPKKGETLRLTPDNWPLYERVIRNYEGHPDSFVRDGQVFVDGQPTDTYTFAMDYYFMMGDNRDNSQDSRFWGFVPEDHIVGTPMFVLVSFDNEHSIFDGGIRWSRIFSDANPDK